MKKLPLALLSCLLLTGCMQATDDTPKTLEERVALAIEEELPMTEVQGFDEPTEDAVGIVYINKRFALGEDRFALAVQPSSNMPVQGSMVDRPDFVGVLHWEDEQWKALAKVTEEDPRVRNNPYAMGIYDNGLVTTVIDQSGTGAGEGLMKRFRMTADGSWILDGCFMFGQQYTKEQGDYFMYSLNWEEQEIMTDDACTGVSLEQQ